MQKAQEVRHYDKKPDESVFKGDIAIVREGKVFKCSMICDRENWNPTILGYSVEIEE